MIRAPILAPVIALVLWTFVMLIWTYATRLPAISRNKVVYDPRLPDAAFHAQLPPEVRWKADNYNHLMEQPTLFYAVAITLALIGGSSELNTALAWVYVVLRIAHSLVQATVNKIMLRFAIFIAATAVLFVLTLQAAVMVF